MNDHTDEFHHCPACAKRTRHRVTRDRKLAAVLWCQRCFHVHMEKPAQQTAPQDSQKAA